MIPLATHFRSNHNDHLDRMRRHEWFIKARQDREKREDRAEKLAEDGLTAGIEMVAATEQQIEAFEKKLDRYDTATVTALMENRKQLDAVNAEIERLLSQAYVMDDGRRVFKTEDGTQVYDETGQAVSEEELDYNLIGSQHPTWETFQEKTGERNELLQERDDILEYQKQLDQSREKLTEDGITEADIEEMDAELEAMMPKSVRAHLPGNASPTAKADNDLVSSSPAAPSSATQSVPGLITPSM